jgi:hypothetical protein
MNRSRCSTRFALFLTMAPALALAQPADDGYCDHVKGTASATAATLSAPQLFLQLGYIEQPTFAVAPDPSVEPNDLRAIGSLRYSFTNLMAAKATTSRADADCRRSRAQSAMQAIAMQIRDTTTARAIAARLAVYDAAQAPADKLLADSQADLEARRITTQEAISTRLRIDDLRSQAAQARRELASLPSPDTKGFDNLMGDYRSADADLERSESRLRTIRAYDLGVRFGADRFLNGSNQETRYIALVEVGVNLGALWVGSGNKRSAAGRARYARTNNPLATTANVDQLRAMIEVQTKRTAQVTALVSDLDRQLQALAAADSADAKRFRETVWFESIKAKAELAYLQAHIQAMTEVLAPK